jgi:predicted phosphoadenosine phosphosulfate sulfurtransferase
MTGRFKPLGVNVFDEALNRMRGVYRAGHRILVSMSGGKDSSICAELCILAASMEGCLPVDVWVRDEEVMLPGTYEYLEQFAQRPEVNFHWFVAGQPVINVCNRLQPYFWVFDDRLQPEQWVRQPPDSALHVPETQDIDFIVMPGRFPPPVGKDLINVQGLRTQESQSRKVAMLSAGGFLTSVRPRNNVRAAYPIYDWTEKDVWTAFRTFGWAYNSAYNMMHQLGLKSEFRRIGPPRDCPFPLLHLRATRRP